MANNAHQLFDQLIEWIRTSDWDTSRAYLKEHAKTLLTNEAERTLEQLHNAQKTERMRGVTLMHQRLLREAQNQGIDAAYEALLTQQRATGVGTNTGHSEIDALLIELKELTEKSADLYRREELCRSILQIDIQTQVLDSARRGAVLATLGNVLQERASGVGGLDHVILMRDAISNYDAALLDLHREVVPFLWAATLNNKAAALNDLAENQTREARTQTMQASIASYNSALLEYRREVAPWQWATTLNNKGNTLLSLAENQHGAERTRTLQEAIACYDDALLEHRRETFPLDWAGALNNKGNALSHLAESQRGTTRTQTLEAAIACFDDALLERHREVAPLDWAGTLNNKGNALRSLAESRSGAEWTQQLVSAIACFDDALLEYRREVVPLDWAMTLNNKGGALRSRAVRLSGLERAQTLTAAIACFDDALLERHREVVPRQWATTLNNKSNALCDLAGDQSGSTSIQTLEAAIACCDEALQERHHEEAPLEWAETNNNKGIALSDLAERLTGAIRIETLEAAIACYDNALLEYSREAAPLDWAMTLNNKGSALQVFAVSQRGDARIEALNAAITCFDDALLERRREVAPFDWAATHTNKGNTLRDLVDELSGEQRLATLQAAAADYREALGVYPPELQPGDYRRIARMLSNIYVRLADYAENASSEETGATWLKAAWQVTSSAITAANLLELQAPSLPFRQREWAENAGIYNLAACIQAFQGHLNEAVTLIERGRARGLAEAAGRRNADLTLLTEEDRGAYLHAVQAVQAIEAQGRQGGDPLALVEEAREANERLAAVVARLRKTYPDFLPERNVTLSELAAALQPGEALAYLITQEAGTLLLVVPSKGEPRLKRLAGLTANDVFTLAIQRDGDDEEQQGFLPAALGWLRRDREALARALDGLLPQLGDRLMRHVVALAREAGCQRVVLVPSGYLSVLPLHAATYSPLAGEPATAPEERRYACDDLAITYAPSGMTLLDARQTAIRQQRVGPAQRLFIAGNPQLTLKDQPWTPQNKGYLRYAEWEARQVDEIARMRTRTSSFPPLTVDLALNEQATWAHVVKGLGAADVAHLALHATFKFDDPQQSAFRVAFQAKLLLRDLLDPQQMNLVQLRLVVLSACQSAMSDVNNQSEEAVGLFGALLAGGVPGVIGTLWSVNDLATAALMESFARRYLVEGQSADVALREASRELRGMRSAPEPEDASAKALSDELTPALRRWHELAERDPEAVDVTRLLSGEELEAAGEAVHRFAEGQSERAIPHDHPVYWAAFVFHGASLSLDGDVSASTAGNGVPAAMQRVISPASVASDDPPVGESRAGDYFPAAEEVCPRCFAQDFIPTRGNQGRELRECLSCRQVYQAPAPLPE